MTVQPKPTIPKPEPPTPAYEIGTNTLLIGDVGSGKTSTLATFIRAGVLADRKLQIAAILTEPGAVETLVDGMKLHAVKGEETLPLDRLHYHYIPPTSEDWQALIDMATRVNTMGYDDLSKIKSGVGKEKHRQFLKMLSAMSDFTDQNGEKFGAIDHLDNTWLVVIDSLSGINNMAKALHVGLKPTLHQGEWGVAMQAEESLINQLVASTKCFTCLTGHVERFDDEVLRKPQFMAGFLGNKLAPKIPRIFSDVILQVRDGDKFKWSTTRRDYSGLKARNLPLADDLEPTFEHIVNKWLERRETAKG